MAFQGGVGSPVHDGVEVQVEDALVAAGQPGGDELGVQGGQEVALVVVRQAVGVLGEGGFLRQDRQPGEQGAGGVVEQVWNVPDVADAPGGGELEGQQGQQPADGGDDAGGGVAGFAGKGGQVEGDQVRDGQQQPGQARGGRGGECGEVDDLGAGQCGVPPRGGRADAGLGLGVA